MSVTTWAAAKHGSTWVVAAEIPEVLCIGLLLLMAPESLLGRMIAVVLLSHLGYTALAGMTSGASSASRQEVRHAPSAPVVHRPATLVRFINEVRRVDAFVQHSADSGLQRSEVEPKLREAQRQLSEAADADSASPDPPSRRAHALR
jgi:hypothetical protein